MRSRPRTKMGGGHSHRAPVFDENEDGECGAVHGTAGPARPPPLAPGGRGQHPPPGLVPVPAAREVWSRSRGGLGAVGLSARRQRRELRFVPPFSLLGGDLLAAEHGAARGLTQGR